MRVSTEAYLRAKERTRIYDRLEKEEQLVLPNLPPPMTANRAKDFPNALPPCKRCQIQCDYCLDYMADNRQNLDFDPLGR